MTWHTAARPDTLWRDTIAFLAACPTCGRDAVWHGHKSNTASGGTDTTYDAIDCPPCEQAWTARAQADRHTTRADVTETAA